MSKRNFYFGTAVVWVLAGILFLTSANTGIGIAAGVIMLINAAISVFRGVIADPEAKRGD